MHYVYRLQSTSHPDRNYIGTTADLRKRLDQHNRGCCDFTRPFRSWKIVFYAAFESALRISDRGLRNGSWPLMHSTPMIPSGMAPGFFAFFAFSLAAMRRKVIRWICGAHICGEWSTRIAFRTEANPAFGKLYESACISGMDSTNLSENLFNFLRASIPTFPAAELLLFLVSHSGRSWTPEQIVEEIKPTAIMLSAVREYLSLFLAQNILEGDLDAGVRFAPASPELRATIDELAHAYNERPVTLIRVIYDLAESNIQSFADAFRLKKE